MSSFMKRGRKSSQNFRKNNSRLVSKKGPKFYGAFYKDDTNEGFAFTVDALSGSIESQKHSKNMIDILTNCTDNMYKDYLKMSKEQKDYEVNYQWGLLKQEIKKFNSIAFPDGIRLGAGVDVDNPELLESATVASTSIDFLTRIGEIENDNYNGMHFMYDDMRIVA